MRGYRAVGRGEFTRTAIAMLCRTGNSAASRFSNRATAAGVRKVAWLAHGHGSYHFDAIRIEATIQEAAVVQLRAIYALAHRQGMPQHILRDIPQADLRILTNRAEAIANGQLVRRQRRR